jgi:hypothetical protein
MWAQMAAMGLSILGGINQYKLAKAQYKAQKTIDDANYEASETIRKASNELGRAQGGLKNWMTSVSNQRMIEAAGDQYNALGENIARHLDQAATGSLQRRVQASEQLGALTAQAAAAGVGGSTSALINGTLRLRNAMVNHEIEKQQGQATYDMLAQRAGIMSNAYDSWDYTFVADTANHMAATKPIRVAPDGTSALLNTLARAAPMAAQMDWGNMFGGGGASTQIANGITPPGTPGEVPPGGYTFFGLRPQGSLLIK